MSFSFVNLLVLAVSAQLSGGSESYFLLSFLFLFPTQYLLFCLLYRLSNLNRPFLLYVAFM